MKKTDLLKYLQECRDLEIALYYLTENPKKNQEKISECLKRLERLYAANIILPKYRNLVPMAMFLDYFENNRCYLFEGSDGAYQLFEAASLDEISVKLSEIKESKEFIIKTLNL